MTRSNTNYRTAMVAPTAGDSIREAHSYEYDNNGNLLYVNTLRLKPDMTAQPDTVQRSREERFRWDEENHLTALSQNGYVSHYWYDADGERTVKMHGGNQAVFVNSRQDGRVLDAQQTTAYFSPYFSIHEGRFTKHLYIGSERIASMTGELKPGDVSNSPAGGYNISHAGYGVGVTQLNIPYATKCAAMIDSAEANYAHFDLPNALEGQTRQLREFVLPAGGDNEAEAPALRSGDKDNYNDNIWFIHSDHLGSSTLVTDGNGEASQQVEYLPYGEVFLECQNGDYATPYKFNGKELDEETGLYYYGARYMNPRLSVWYGCDPSEEKYQNISSYTYCIDNPIRVFDNDGNEWEDIEGNTLKDHTNIKAYIFYDPHSFMEQSLAMYKDLVSKYGKGSVALSCVTTEKEFLQDWRHMQSPNIMEVNVNYHGNNQTIMLDASKNEYITSTGDGLTNRSGSQATNVQDLPTPIGNINNATLNLNTCKSNSTNQYPLKGSGKTLMKTFYEQFHFKTVRGTSAGVSYNRITKRPEPQFFWQQWDYMGAGPSKTQYKEITIPLYYRTGGMK